MEHVTLSDRDYSVISELLFKRSGISLGSTKKALVASRLYKRVQLHGFSSYGSYFDHLLSGMEPDELQTVVNLLTTNETYFFREPDHFERLSALAQAAPKHKTFRVWSAACSSGEEVYTIAMTLQELSRKGRCPPWEVRGSDLSTIVLEKARAGLYSLDRTGGISPELMKRYFLKGCGPHEGQILVSQELRDKVDFAQINLIDPLPSFKPFDVIFLRNVMIYFEAPIKRKVVKQLMSALSPNGVLFVGLAETLNGLVDGLVSVGPSVYQLSETAK